MMFCPEEYSFLGYTERFFREDSFKTEILLKRTQSVLRKQQEFFQKEPKAISFFLKEFLTL